MYSKNDATYSLIDYFKEGVKQGLSTYNNFFSEEDQKEILDSTKLEYLIDKEIIDVTKNQYKCYHVSMCFSCLNTNIYISFYYIKNVDEVYSILVSSPLYSNLKSNETMSIINSFTINNYKANYIDDNTLFNIGFIIIGILIIGTVVIIIFVNLRKDKKKKLERDVEQIERKEEIKNTEDDSDKKNKNNNENEKKCYCSNCGYEIKDEWSFCNNCGKKIIK